MVKVVNIPSMKLTIASGRELGRGLMFQCAEWAGRSKGPLTVKSVVPKHWNDLALDFHYT